MLAPPLRATHHATGTDKRRRQIIERTQGLGPTLDSLLEEDRDRR